MPRRLVGGAEIGRGKQTALADGGKLYAGIRRRGARLVPDDMGFLADHDVIPRTGQQLQADLVGHRAARHEESSFLAEQFGDALLQPVDRGILAILVVAHRCFRHCLSHLRRGPGHRVGAQIDRRSDLRHRRLPGRQVQPPRLIEIGSGRQRPRR